MKPSTIIILTIAGLLYAGGWVIFLRALLIWKDKTAWIGILLLLLIGLLSFAGYLNSIGL